MLLTSVMNRPEDKNMLIAAPHSSLPDVVSGEAGNCFCSAFPLVSKGERRRKQSHFLQGFSWASWRLLKGSSDPFHHPADFTTSFPEPKLLLWDQLLQTLQGEYKCYVPHKLYQAWTRYRAWSLFFLRLWKHMFHSSIIHMWWGCLLLVISVLCRYKIFKTIWNY